MLSRLGCLWGRRGSAPDRSDAGAQLRAAPFRQSRPLSYTIRGGPSAPTKPRAKREAAVAENLGPDESSGDAAASEASGGPRSEEASFFGSHPWEAPPVGLAALVPPRQCGEGSASVARARPARDGLLGLNREERRFFARRVLEKDPSENGRTRAQQLGGASSLQRTPNALTAIQHIGQRVHLFAVFQHFVVQVVAGGAAGAAYGADHIATLDLLSGLDLDL